MDSRTSGFNHQLRRNNVAQGGHTYESKDDPEDATQQAKQHGLYQQQTYHGHMRCTQRKAYAEFVLSLRTSGQ